MSFIKTDREKYPTIKAARHPAKTGQKPTEEETSARSLSSRIKAPRIAGIETIKE